MVKTMKLYMYVRFKVAIYKFDEKRTQYQEIYTTYDGNINMFKNMNENFNYVTKMNDFLLKYHNSLPLL